MPDPRISVSREGPVAILRIVRPDKRNALDLDMLAALGTACDEIDADHALRAAVITGEGKTFCAGGDIAAWAALAPERFGYDWVRPGHRVLARLAELRVPLIGAINGPALGGGLELAACADIRIAAPEARLGLPETGLGMVPGWSGTQRLVRRFGPQLVRRMALGGEVFTASEALALGLVDRVAQDALAAALDYARAVAARGPAAVQTAKMMIAAASGEGDGTPVEVVASILAAKTGDLKEGVAAFAGKRSPRFKGEW